MEGVFPSHHPQFDAYLPYSELFMSVPLSTEEMPYKFNATDTEETDSLPTKKIMIKYHESDNVLSLNQYIESGTDLSAFAYCSGISDPTSRNFIVNDSSIEKSSMSELKQKS